jgi:hypothetical protein
MKAKNINLMAKIQLQDMDMRLYFPMRLKKSGIIEKV